MQRLIDNQLIFGRLWPVTEPHLVERYNQALEGFGLKRVDLETFNIDMAGYSPEVAAALGDQQYLDPHGVNRRFIILTPAQRDLPVVHTRFSNTSQLMFEFMQSNARAINARSSSSISWPSANRSSSVP